MGLVGPSPSYRLDPFSPDDFFCVESVHLLQLVEVFVGLGVK